MESMGGPDARSSGTFARPPHDVVTAARLVAVLVGIAVLVLTLWPFRLMADGAAWQRGVAGSLAWVDWPVLLHLAAAGVLGVALSLGWRRVAGSGWAIRLAVAIGAAVCLEAAQSLVAARHPSVADIIAHAFGAVAGLAAGDALAGRLRLGRRSLALGLWGLVGVCTVAAVGLAATERRFTGFGNWDDKAVLVFGNEATGDRPWRGTIHGVALFDEALEEQQVRYLTRERYRGAAAVADRLKRRAIAVYSPHNTYQLSSVTALRWMGSGRVGEGLDLYTDAGQPARAGTEGVSLRGAALLATREPAAELTRALRRRGAFSVEAYITPASVAQDGPARIVSLSRSPGKRNFTLAQEGSGVGFRLRTPLSGPNGDEGGAEAHWPGVFLDTQPRHLVVTYGHGELRLYVNGEPHGEPWRLQATHRVAAAAPGATPAATMLLAAAALLFPLGLAGPALWDRARRPRRAVVGWLAIGGVAAVAFHMALGPQAFAYAAAAAAAGVLLGVWVHPRQA